MYRSQLKRCRDVEKVMTLLCFAGTAVSGLDCEEVYGAAISLSERCSIAGDTFLLNNYDATLIPRWRRESCELHIIKRLLFAG
ncbi:hypothetical protein GW17_00028597 [Ensete ventricosum]|nr:hypothetical protein GW17_00028597 [Ensete ventricosum]